ncbi:nipblb [Symbiodinium microadriaticum]|nr:nipblb [Symbiodinium microadriaticum]
MDSRRFLLLKCHDDPPINSEHISMNRDLLRPLAKAYGRFKDIATVPVLKIVFQELKGKLVDVDVADAGLLRRPSFKIRYIPSGRKDKKDALAYEKLNGERMEAELGMQFHLLMAMMDRIIRLTATYIGHLRPNLASEKYAKRRAKHLWQEVHQQGSLSQSYEISDDECECVDAKPSVDSPVATSPPALPSPSSSKPQVDMNSSSSQLLLTRTAQLQLAHSKKMPGRGKRVRRECLSKCSLAIARQRSKNKLEPKKRKAEPPKEATNKKPKGKGKAKAFPKATPKAKARSKAAAKCKAKAKAKPTRKIGLPGDAEIRSYHDLTRKFRQTREGESFGEVAKDQRPLLREKIHVSKKLLCLL